VGKVLYAPGILLFFAISAPWFYLVCRENPDFFRFFFIQEHFMRYLTKMHDRYEPFWFFLPMIPAGLMPWTGFLISLVSPRGVLRRPASPEGSDANIFLVVWFAVILIFFSLSDSKLIPYIVPCLPPLAILIAGNMERMMCEGRWFGGALWWSVGINALFIAALFVYAATGDDLGRTEALVLAVVLSAGLLGGSLSALSYWTRGKNVRDALASLCVGALVFSLSLQALYVPFGRTRSAFGISEVVAANKLQGERIAVYGEVLQGVPFYTKERVMLVDYAGELEYGAGNAGEAERADWFPDGEKFLARWHAGEPIALIIKKRRLNDLFGDGASLSKKAIETGNYVIIFNRES
jgi:4-amino-4-deoxy-L-arabinose transferase-like glycosyltransferase